MGAGFGNGAGNRAEGDINAGGVCTVGHRDRVCCGKTELAVVELDGVAVLNGREAHHVAAGWHLHRVAAVGASALPGSQGEPVGCVCRCAHVVRRDTRRSDGAADRSDSARCCHRSPQGRACGADLIRLDQPATAVESKRLRHSLGMCSDRLARARCDGHPLRWWLRVSWHMRLTR